MRRPLAFSKKAKRVLGQWELTTWESYMWPVGHGFPPDPSGEKAVHVPGLAESLGIRLSLSCCIKLVIAKAAIVPPNWWKSDSSFLRSLDKELWGLRLLICLYRLRIGRPDIDSSVFATDGDEEVSVRF